MNKIDYSIIITYMQHFNEENLKLFGEMIQEMRKKKSSSLNKIAFSHDGVTSATLSRIENGQVDFKFSTLIKLANTLDISLVELFKNYKYKNLNEDT